VGEALGYLILLIVVVVKTMFGLTPEQRAERAAKELAKAQAKQRAVDERASQRQRQEWFDEAGRQKARGSAGFAPEAEALAALRGKGGRSSNLDNRWFS
jgi:hypothetical protein